MTKGWKFLNPYGATEQYNIKSISGETLYPLPKPDEKWGEWFEHPNPSEFYGADCGEGRFHVMRKIDARYAPDNWWIWFAEVDNILGESSEKISATKIRLRRVTRKVFWKIIRFGYCCNSNLIKANLSRADLRGADLSETILNSADLRGADLSEAILRGANLSEADLSGADLSEALLSEALLSRANLSGADLRGANLSGADLSGADLSGADLRGADLSGADLNGADLLYSNLNGADLSRANLNGANLRFTILDKENN